MGLMDDWRQVVLDLHEQGLSRTEITAQVPMSSVYVSKIVDSAGRSFADTSRTADATQGRIAKRTKDRVAQAEQLIPLAEQAFAAGNVPGFLALSDTIHKLLGFGTVEALRATEKDPDWIARVMGLPHS